MPVRIFQPPQFTSLIPCAQAKRRREADGAVDETDELHVIPQRIVARCVTIHFDICAAC